ncbi:MAG: hypothetical protein ACE148_11415 [Vicinamibacterales bacterium]
MSRMSSLACCAAIALVLAVLPATPAGRDQTHDGWRRIFKVEKSNLSSTGRNTYFVLEPGYRLTYRNGKDTLVITVLDQTRTVDGVVTRVVEERETEGGELAEVSRNYFAIDKATGDVYYFGEEVDIYEGGKVTGHEGAWLSGDKGATFGLMMPGKPVIGDRYYQEVAPGVAMDRAEIVSLTEAAKVPAGSFAGCLRVRESSALESGSEEKVYAPGVGLVIDGSFVLVSK